MKRVMLRQRLFSFLLQRSQHPLQSQVAPVPGPKSMNQYPGLQKMSQQEEVTSTQRWQLPRQLPPAPPPQQSQAQAQEPAEDAPEEIPCAAAEAA